LCPAFEVGVKKRPIASVYGKEAMRREKDLQRDKVVR
jgi:hypothetical protein